MEVTKEYKLAYVQVLEILKKLNKSEFNRIPKEKIELYEKNKDNNYKFELINTEKIEEQIFPITKLIIANLFVRYIASEKDKKEIYENEKKEYIKKGIEIRRQIQIKPIFEEKEENNLNRKNALIIKKDKNFFEKVFDKIINWFRGR